MYYTNVLEDYVPLKCELKGLHNNQEVVRIVNDSHPIKLKYVNFFLNSYRIILLFISFHLEYMVI